MTTDNIVPVCIICGEVPKKGFKDGFFVRRQFICHACEKEICRLDHNNEAEYYRIVKSLAVLHVNC